MALPLLAAGAAISGVGSLIKTGLGLFQSNSAAKDQKNNIRPKFTIPKEWYDDRNLAGSRAQSGLSDETMDYYTGEATRGLSSGLGTILQGGGSVNTVADLYDSYDSGLNRISAADAEAKNANLDKFINANANLANEREKAWTLNEYQPYLDRSKANAQKMANGQANFVGGINDLGNTVTAYSNSQNSVKEGAAPAAKAVAPAAVDAFSTPGGRSVLEDLMSNNRNSPYLKGLISALNQPI
jgi:hypothetical protein